MIDPILSKRERLKFRPQAHLRAKFAAIRVVMVVMLASIWLTALALPSHSAWDKNDDEDPVEETTQTVETTETPKQTEWFTAGSTPDVETNYEPFRVKYEYTETKTVTKTFKGDDETSSTTNYTHTNRSFVFDVGYGETRRVPLKGSTGSDDPTFAMTSRDFEQFAPRVQKWRAEVAAKNGAQQMAQDVQNKAEHQSQNAAEKAAEAANTRSAERAAENAAKAASPSWSTDPSASNYCSTPPHC